MAMSCNRFTCVDLLAIDLVTLQNEWNETLKHLEEYANEDEGELYTADQRPPQGRQKQKSKLVRSTVKPLIKGVLQVWVRVGLTRKIQRKENKVTRHKFQILSSAKHSLALDLGQDRREGRG